MGDLEYVRSDGARFTVIDEHGFSSFEIEEPLRRTSLLAHAVLLFAAAWAATLLLDRAGLLNRWYGIAPIAGFSVCGLAIGRTRAFDRAAERTWLVGPLSTDSSVMSYVIAFAAAFSVGIAIDASLANGHAGAATTVILLFFLQAAIERRWKERAATRIEDPDVVARMHARWDELAERRRGRYVPYP